MSYFRTAILLAVMTALFMGIGFMIGGQGGIEHPGDGRGHGSHGERPYPRD